MLDLDLCQDRGVRLRKFQWDAPAQALAVSRFAAHGFGSLMRRAADRGLPADRWATHFYVRARACAKSSIMASASSIPTETLTKVSLMPIFPLSSAESCV